MGWREGFVILAPNPARFHAIVTGCSTATNSFPILAVRKYQCPRIVRCSIHFTQPTPVDPDESTGRHRRPVLSGSAGLAFMSYARPPKTHDGITEKVAVIWRKPPLRPPGRMSRRLGPRKARVPRSFSGFETENRCVQRLGGAHRIKIFPQERDLAVHGPQEDHIILAIHTARRLNESLPLDLGDRALRIG